MKKKVEVKVGSVWNTVDSEKFVVIKVEKKAGIVWVFYKPYKSIERSVKEYSCYQEAFVERFFEFTNVQH